MKHVRVKQNQVTVARDFVSVCFSCVYRTCCRDRLRHSRHT